MSPLLLAILAYVALQLLIGAWISRRIRSEDDYLVAGRRMGPLLATGTFFATWFGAETCLGSAGDVYANGVGPWTSEPFGYGLCLVFLGLVFAVRLWKLRLTTLADYFRARYSRGVEVLAALLMIPTSLLWAAAQIHAFGTVLAASASLEPWLAITLAASAVVLYTTLGGLLADAITDLVQGACLIVGLFVMLAGVVAGAGGLEAALELLDSAPVAAAAPAPAWQPLSLLEAWSVPILGSVVAQELVVRVSASRSSAVARGAALAGGAGYVLVGLVPVLLGRLGASLVPGLENPEEVLPSLARTHLGTLGHALFAGALVSAILSTVDSTLLVCSSLFAHNVLLPRLPGIDERGKLRLARAGTVAFGLLAYLLALRADGVSALVELASSLGSAGLFVILVLGLFTRRGGAPSAYAALVGGLAGYVGASVAALELPFLTSLACAFSAYGLALAWPRRA